MSEQVFRIPLEPAPQRFAIELSGVPLLVVCRWNEAMTNWELELLDGETEVSLVASLPLVTGADLLAQHPHLGIPGQLLVSGQGEEETTPTLENLGSTVDLYYVVPA